MAVDWAHWASVHKQSAVGVFFLALVFRLISTLVHRACLKRFKTEDEASVATYRITGLCHHLVQIPIAFMVLWDSSMWNDRLFGSSGLSTVMLVVSSGYFLHDFIHCVENWRIQGISYVIHGAGCAAVFLFSLFHVPTMLHFYGAGFLMWEISSFPVHGRWFLFKLNASQKLQLLNGLALLLTFFFARIVWGFYLSYMYWVDILAYKQATTSFVYTTLTANIALNALNSYWFYLILTKAIDALTGRQKDAPGKRD